MSALEPTGRAADSFELLRQVRTKWSAYNKVYQYPFSGQVKTYPGSPAELKEVQPDVWENAYSKEAPGACPFDEYDLARLRSSLPARSSHAALVTGPAAALCRSSSQPAALVFKDIFAHDVTLMKIWGQGRSEN